MVLYISSVFLLSSLLCLIVHRKLIRQTLHYRKQSMELMQEMIEHSHEHRKIFGEMMAKIHHSGIVPISATAWGLRNVISMVVEICLISLQKYQKNKDWRTFTISEALFNLTKVELALLESELKKLNEEAKNKANEYDKYQRENNWE